MVSLRPNVSLLRGDGDVHGEERPPIGTTGLLDGT